MSHCISQPSKAIEVAGGMAKVHMVPAASDNISWLIEYSPKRVAVVDGPSLQPILEYCEDHLLCITHILNTHIHGDHIGVNFGLSKAKLSHPDLLAQRVEVWGAAATHTQIPHISRVFNDSDRFNLGDLQGVVWLTEGHLDGHISFILWAANGNQLPEQGDQSAVFCGDTLFAAGCGRLFDGPAQKMYSSLQRLCHLPKDTLLFPAHEYTLDNLQFAHFAKPDDQAIAQRLIECIQIRQEGRSTLPTSVHEELETNPFVKANSVELFAQLRQMKDIAAHRV